MAFRLLNNKITFPALYPKVERELATVKKKSKTVVGGFTLRHNVDFIPQVGLQEDVCASECNLIFMCGQGTAGKTFALYFKALGGCDKYGFTARIISFQQKDNEKGSSMLRDGITVCGNFAGCEQNVSKYPTFMWRQWNSNLQLIHCNFNGDNPDEFDDFMEYAKKQQASLITIDEATAIKKFDIFLFWFMRNRDSSGMIPQMILTFNPKHTHWTTAMLRDAGFLDEQGFYLRKDMIGKIRYFYNMGDTPDKIIWGRTKAEVVERAGLVLKPEDEAAGLTVYDYVKSFTVFTGTAADNRELVNATGGQSVANLHAVGGTQRKVVGEAYFGPIDNESINVNRQMIHNLWENPINDDANLYATMDISSGGAESDNAPMIIWRGLQMIAIEYFRGTPNEISPWIQSKLAQYGVPITNFAYDATGVGYFMQGLTNGVAITFNKSQIQEYDEYGNPVTRELYFKLRSQLYGKTEVLLKTSQISCAIPKDKLIPFKKGQRRFIDALFDQMNAFITMDRQGKIYYRSKEEFKSKFKYSPDEIDAMILRAYFELDTRERKQPKPQVADDAYDALTTSCGAQWGRNAWNRINT